MARNVSSQTLTEGLPNALNSHKLYNKQNRVNQNYPKGWFPLPVGTADPTGAPDGSMYYNSTTFHIRAKINGVWVTVI